MQKLEASYIAEGMRNGVASLAVLQMVKNRVITWLKNSILPQK